MTHVLDHLKRVSGGIYRGGSIAKCSGASGLDVIDPATENVIGVLTDWHPPRPAWPVTQSFLEW